MDEGSFKSPEFFLLFRKTNQSGFTLLEALVSLVILGICFGVFFQGLSQSKRISWRSDQMAQASRVANNLLVDPDLLGEAIEKEVVEGQVPGEQGWYFKITSEPLAIEMGEDLEPLEVPGIFSLRLELSLAERPQKPIFSITRWYHR